VSRLPAWLVGGPIAHTGYQRAAAMAAASAAAMAAVSALGA
jgi:hypothetical protein